jgi:hypothetical protein
MRHLQLAADSAERAGRDLLAVRQAVPLRHLVRQGAGGADGDAGAAELAAGGDVRVPPGRPDQRARPAVLERQHGRTAHLVTHAHAAAAQDAEVVVAVVERVVVLGLQAPVGDRVGDVRDPDTLDDPLQLAALVVRTAVAAGRDPCLVDGLLAAFALGLLVADQTARRMLREDQLQHLAAHLAQCGRVADHDHAFLDQGAAGQRVAAHAGDLDRAEPATAERRELLVGAERRHVDAGRFRRLQNGRAFRDRHLEVVDLEGAQRSVGARERVRARQWLSPHRALPRRSRWRRRRWRRSGRPRSTSGT